MQRHTGQGMDTLPPITPGENSRRGSLPLRRAGRWLRWQMRALVLLALCGCVGLFSLARALAESPHLPVQQRLAGGHGVELGATALAQLQGSLGKQLTRIESPAAPGGPGLDPATLSRSLRWTVSDDARAQAAQSQLSLARLLQGQSVVLRFADGSAAAVVPQPRGLAGLGLLFWLCSTMALLLYLVSTVVLLARPQWRNLLYLVMALCQAGNLVHLAMESMPGLGLPLFAMQFEPRWRTMFDLLTCAAALHASTLQPLRSTHPRLIALLAWGSAVAVGAGVLSGGLAHAWAWTQAACVALGLGAVWVLGASYQKEPNPLALTTRRFAVAAVGTLVLLTVAVLAAGPSAPQQGNVGAVGSFIWYVFFSSVLLLLPFLVRTHGLMREFALLAGVSTVATSLDLLFVAAFSLSHFASLSLAVFMSLGLYAAARQWLLSQMLGGERMSAEQMFERLYRIVREVERKPEQGHKPLIVLLRDLFEPLEVAATPRISHRSRVMADGAGLYVPLPLQPEAPQSAGAAVMMRYAGRGKRIFTGDDARLTDQVVQQLVRAVAYDKAVERGRAEERLRIAQDLHDDIGARLLTLMYQAQTPEMEDYLRHTLQDLKTLTRGLAATDHRLTHAVAEWKADITQRLVAAHIMLHWQFHVDEDLPLTMVQWSALTRVLRELVSNAISHAQASNLWVEGMLQNGRLTLQVSDDGSGGDPATWAHGLGLGGVRKRVKVLGGEVRWLPRHPRGTVCEVLVGSFAPQG